MEGHKDNEKDGDSEGDRDVKMGRQRYSREVEIKKSTEELKMGMSMPI
jgi:hypothetical protein